MVPHLPDNCIIKNRNVLKHRAGWARKKVRNQSCIAKTVLLQTPGGGKEGSWAAGSSIVARFRHGWKMSRPFGGGVVKGGGLISQVFSAWGGGGFLRAVFFIYLFIYFILSYLIYLILFHLIFFILSYLFYFILFILFYLIYFILSYLFIHLFYLIYS